MQRVLDLKYMARFRPVCGRSDVHDFCRNQNGREKSGVNISDTSDANEVNEANEASDVGSDGNDGKYGNDRRSFDLSKQPRHVLAECTKQQVCFDSNLRVIEGGDVMVGERVMLVLIGDRCTTTRVAESGEFLIAEVQIDGFSNFEPVH